MVLKKMRKFGLLVVTPLMIAALIIACSSSDSETESKASSVAREPAAVPSGLLSQQVQDVDGNWHEMSEWIGQKPVAVNLWGTWCPPCRREIPDLIRLYDEYGDEVEIVSLAIERRASPAQVKQFAQNAGMNWVMLMADDEVLRNLGYGGNVPTTIFFDAQGREVNRHIGARRYDVFKKDFEAVAGT